MWILIKIVIIIVQYDWINLLSRFILSSHACKFENLRRQPQCCWTVAKAVFDSLCVIYFVLWIQSLTSKHPVHLFSSLPCKWKRKKKRKDTHVGIKPEQKLFRNCASKVMLSQMHQWISKLFLCEAFIGLQCRRQHFCLIVTVVMSALPCINPHLFSTWQTSCKRHNSCSMVIAIFVPAQVCIDERDHKLMFNFMDNLFNCHWWLTMFFIIILEQYHVWISSFC